MSEVKDMSSQTNFTMLTEHLYTLIRHYITNGRIKAPPEWELRDLIPTFQLGCKTNRRALQSKFKSWAKRMSVENDNLVLASSGKLIVPKEKCEELIMNLHSNNHMPVNLIAFKIQQNYTWTKRNFGMDHEEVVKVIASHCKKYECWRYIKNSFIKKNSSADIPRTPFIPVPSRSILGPADGKLKVFGLKHQPLDFISQRNLRSEFDPCPLSFRNSYAECNMLRTMPPLNSFLSHTESSAGFQEENTVSNNQNQHFNSYPSSSNVNSVYMKENHSMSEISHSKNQFLQALGLSRKQVKVNYKLAPNIRSHKVDKSLVRDYDSKGKRISLKRSCKKIRNIIEFKRLLKSAEDNPKSFPAILMNQKTKFLGSLSLAPKQICSRKLLSKFKEEIHKKKVLKRRSWYMGRKGLRDRNKILKKMPHHKKPEHLSYLTLKNTSACNFIARLDNTKNKRMFEKDNDGFYAKKQAKVSGLQPNEAKYFPVTLKTIDHTDKGLKAILMGNNQRKDKNDIFPSRKQVYLNETLAKSCGSSIQVLSNRCCQGMNRNTTKESSTSHEEQSKNVQKRMGLENISELKFSNANGSSLKTYSTSSNKLTTPQPQFPFIQPVLIPTTPVTPNTGLPTHFPVIVRPMTKAQSLTINDISQNSKNNSTVWGYLANGRVNILNQKDNFKSENLQPKPLPKNTREFTGNRLGKNGTNVLLIQPYRVLEKKIKVSSGIETQNITTGKSFTHNSLQKNVYVGIPGNAIENSFASSTSDVNLNVSIPKDVDVEIKKLKKWIQRMMLNIVPCICTFGKDIEILKMDLLAELNYGINLVKEIRKAVKETE